MTETDFARAFGEAIAARGVTLEWLHRRLEERGRPVSIGALSYWRSGRSRPEHRTSLEALDVLEELLGLDEGDLSSRLGPSRRPEPSGWFKRRDQLMAAPQAIREVISELGFDPDEEDFVEVMTHVVLEVDETGSCPLLQQRTLWRARRSGTDRLPFVLAVAEEVPGVPEFEAVRGCRLGVTHHVPDDQVYGVELLLGRPLAAGETALTEFVARVPPGVTDTVYLHTMTRRMAELLVWVSFHPDKPPAAAEAFTDTGDVVPLTLQGDGSLHHVVRNVGPGRVGVRWSWPA